MESGGGSAFGNHDEHKPFLSALIQSTLPDDVFHDLRRVAKVRVRARGACAVPVRFPISPHPLNGPLLLR